MNAEELDKDEKLRGLGAPPHVAQGGLDEFMTITSSQDAAAEDEIVKSGGFLLPDYIADELISMKAPGYYLYTRIAGSFDFQSVQVDLDGEIADIQHVLANRVAKEDLADKGRETDPHITVRYGFPAEVTAANVKDAVAGIPWAYLQFRETRFFEGSPDYDVLYVAVASDELERMNEALAKLPHEDTHSTYTPHMTVAYLKKGMGAKYSGDRLAYGKATFADHLTFSDLRGNKTKIKLMSGY